VWAGPNLARSQPRWRGRSTDGPLRGADLLIFRPGRAAAPAAWRQLHCSRLSTAQHSTAHLTSAQWRRLQWRLSIQCPGRRLGWRAGAVLPGCLPTGRRVPLQLSTTDSQIRIHLLGLNRTCLPPSPSFCFIFRRDGCKATCIPTKLDPAQAPFSRLPPAPYTSCSLSQNLRGCASPAVTAAARALFASPVANSHLRLVLSPALRGSNHDHGFDPDANLEPALLRLTQTTAVPAANAQMEDDEHAVRKMSRVKLEDSVANGALADVDADGLTPAPTRETGSPLPLQTMSMASSPAARASVPPAPRSPPGCLENRPNVRPHARRRCSITFPT